ncbi:hypothetical protein C7974DRAFT_433126 [Boeremia exigua]|uniref:uncharacterized protein n=1 Tax=Boeremia exigua TaxID=749465 RepID=UPI001E8D9613|nr:uncharacterized protein C7974DRAFT_433126 [Boeremia exigua]KAH6632916.1 hypothetical protein C7974DRAFT_433126 [Boeremia exigua]
MATLSEEQILAVEAYGDESDGELRWSSPSMMCIEDRLPVAVYRQSWWTTWKSGDCWRGLRYQRSERPDQIKRGQKPHSHQWAIVAVFALTFLSLTAGIVYSSLVAILLYNLKLPPNHSGLQHIVEDWREPNTNATYEFAWRADFSRDIVPKDCHSHNDYWRPVPLYSALAAGCVSVEADVWLAEDSELLVSHSWKTTTQARTLNSLYLKPLLWIFDKRNISQASVEDREVGVFDADPNVSVVLLIDFKGDRHAIWPVLLTQLKPLQNKNWLTYYDGEKIHCRPLTIVGTGNTPIELVQSTLPDRFVSFNALLTSISNTTYNYTNSYYASARLEDAIRKLWLNRLSIKQEETLREQVKRAEEKGLKSRY